MVAVNMATGKIDPRGTSLINILRGTGGGGGGYSFELLGKGSLEKWRTYSPLSENVLFLFSNCME